MTGADCDAEDAGLKNPALHSNLISAAMNLRLPDACRESLQGAKAEMLV